MTNYPDAVAQIVADYVERMKAKLPGVPVREQNEFIMEIESHVYEAYQQTPGTDDVTRVLAVLRNLGEPADVVSDRLPSTMMRYGSKRKLPLYILYGILLAFFGIPLGFSGLGTLIGVLSSLAGLMLAYFAVAGCVLLVGGLFLLLGLARAADSALWDRLIALGYIQINGPFGDFFNQLPVGVQALSMLLLAGVFIATGAAMLWLGKYMLQGLRFLCALLFHWLSGFAQTVRRKLAEGKKTTAASPQPEMERAI